MKNQVKPGWAKLSENESGIDVECLSLCETLNQFPGIETTSSCCGHGDSPFRIWFDAANLEVLPPIVYYFDGCHCGFYGWDIIVKTDCSMRPVNFMIEGPKGDQVYKEADKIAEMLMDEFNSRYGEQQKGSPYD